MPDEASLAAHQQYTFFPTKIELASTITRLTEEIERSQPACLVLDSLSELRLLASDNMRYRRQLLALKQFFAGRKTTALLLDDRTANGHDLQLQSIAHGVNGVTADSSKRNYALALDRLSSSAGNGGNPSIEYSFWDFARRCWIRDLSPSTINVKLSAIRSLVDEAKRAEVLGADDASYVSDVPRVAQRGTRLGKWLTKEQARKLLAVPDRSTIKGKGLRDS